MKVLYLTEILPYPLDSGGKIKTFSTLKSLAKKHEITLIAFSSEKKPDKSAIYEINKLGVKVHSVYSKKRKFGAKFSRLEVLQSIFSFTPLLIRNSQSIKFKKTIQNILARQSFDIIHIDHLSMAQYLPSNKTSKWYYEEHNIEYRLYWQLFKNSSSFNEKAVHLYEFFSLYFFERKYLGKFDKVFAISKKDKEYLLSGFNLITPIEVLSIPFKTSKKPKPNKLAQVDSLLFLGSLYWQPNLDAASWFCREIMPRINMTFPELTLTIVGSFNKDIERKFHKFTNCHLAGHIENLEAYLKKGNFISVLPTRLGEGIRVKALYAMANGIPLVSTTKGMEGIEAKREKDYLEADSEKIFASQVTKLLDNPRVRKKLIKNSRSFIKKNHHEEINLRVWENY